MDASGASSSTRPLDTRAQRRQQKKAARRLADEARIGELGAIRVQQQQQLRSTLASAMTTPSADALQQARADVVGLVNLKHRLDELDVPLSIVKAAVERIVISSNFEALLSLALQPLSFDPADYPDAFERDGKGKLYIRQDSLGTLDDLDAYEFTTYNFQPTLTIPEDVKDRLEADEGLPPQTRLGNWLKMRGPAASMSIWALRDVDMPAADAYEFRSSEVAQEMERILIAIVGLSALNSAVGGHSYPWDTQIYHGLSQDFFRHIDNKAPPANITTALNPSLAQPRLGNNIRSAIQEFLFRMRRDHGDATGTMVSGRALTRVMEIASSAVSPLRSLVVMKDITREQVTVNRPNLHYFGTEALSRARASTGTTTTLRNRRNFQPAEDHHRASTSLANSDVLGSLVVLVVLFLSQLLVLVQPQVIRVQSSKVSNIFLNGHIFNVEAIQGYEWEDLPVSRWLDKVCSIYILDEPLCILILALHPGSVKYDPLLSRHRTRLLYLAMLLQRGSELLIMRGISPQEARQILISCDPFQEEVARVKKAFEIDQHAVWSLRNQTALTSEEADERSTRMRMVATSAHERHGKAIGQPWSEERLRAWDDYVNSGPSDPWIITAALSTIPCPASLSPRSEEHKAWYCSRRSGVDLVLSAGQYDTPRRDPDQHEDDFDWMEYVATRRRAQASRAVTRQLIVGGIEYRLYHSCEAACEARLQQTGPVHLLQSMRLFVLLGRQHEPPLHGGNRSYTCPASSVRSQHNAGSQ
ncbi:hypothetical protein CF326_g8350 [Tilletia indica]|nr:hypothetical protein CF326_g8350 [Tilletia indica]